MPVELEDRLTITTPEGVELDLQLAGLGARYIAQVVDLAIKVAAIGLTALVLLAAGLTGLAIFLPAFFLIQYGYDVVFETFAGGRTPGKMAARLRVVRTGGEPVDFASSAIRNILRVVDGIPFSYVPGIVSILVTKRNQRLGDLAAGTIVIHEERPLPGPPPVWGPPGWGPPQAPPPQPGWGPTWDVSAVSASDAAAVRSFLERRWTIDVRARGALAQQLAEALWPKVAGAPGGLPPEAFLEQLAQQKASRR